jgi:hypothetical protein
MLRLFRGTGVGVIMLMILIAGGLWVNSFINSEIRGVDEVHNPMFLYGLLQMITGSSALTGKIAALILVLIIASVLIAFNTSTFFINERTFLPGILYIVLVSLFPAFQYLTPVLPASIFLIMAIIRIAGTYRKNGIAYSYYDAALMIGTGSLFYASLIWFGALLFVGILLLRTFNLREVFVSILGLLTPYIILYGIFFVADYDLSELTGTISDCLFDSNAGILWSRMTIVTTIFILVTILIASLQLFSVFTTKKVKSRKIFSLHIWTVIVTLVVYLISPSAGEELIFIFAIPVSFILSHYYIQRKRKKIVPEIMFSGTIILIVLLQILGS